MIKKLFKILFGLFILLIILIIGTHFYIKKAINSPEFKEKINQQIELTTKRKSQFGKIDYSFVPPTLLIKDVALKTKDGNNNFIALKTLDVKVDPSKYEISNIILDTPEIIINQH